MMSHLTNNNLISPQQHGFVNNKSCDTNLLETLDIITETLNRGFSVDLAFLDFAKAFDKVSHSGLLVKLEAFGFDQLIIKWVEAFLNDRRQRVVLGDVMSSWEAVMSGIGQGTSIGPLLFIIFINDMTTKFKHPCKLFADDSKLISVIRNISDCHQLQTDLDEAVQWSRVWKMEFNNDKCKVMHLGRKNRILTTYSLLETQNDQRTDLQTTSLERDLGIHISSDLKWHHHSKIAANKALAVLGILQRSFSYWTTDTIKPLFNTFVRPHLEYAATAWSPYHKQDIVRLENVQRRATKLVPCLKNMSYEDRLKYLNMTSLSDRRARGDAIQYYKCVNGHNLVNWYHPNSLTNSLNVTGPANAVRGHRHRLDRQYTPKCPSRHNFFTNRVVPIWNAIPPEAIEAQTVNAFKSRYDESLKIRTNSINHR